VKDIKPAGRGPFAVKLAKIAPNDHVLNVGCFDGALERHFMAGRVASCTGVDVNKTAVKFAQKLAEKQPTPMEFLIAESEKLPFENQKFSVVFCLDTLEHVNDEAQTLSEIARVLKPNGVLVLSVPHDFLNFLDPDELTRDARNLVRKYIRKKPLLDHPEHRHYSEEQLRVLLKDFDFDIEIVHKCGTPAFWILAMTHTALGLPEKLIAKMRRVTDPIENVDYALKLPTGFNIMVRARKRRS